MKLDLEYLRDLILQEATAMNFGDLALKVGRDNEIVDVYLFTVPDVQLVATAQARKTDKPCIPETWQVTSIAVRQDLQSQKLGFFLYKVIIAELNGRGFGVTSDHSVGTEPKAAKFWKRLEGEGSIAIKRKTKEGNDTFDYPPHETPDPDDDCDAGMGGQTPATDHSWALTNSVYAATEAEAKKLKSNNFKFILSGEKKAFVEKLPSQFSKNFDYYLEIEANRLFQDAYLNEMQVSDFKLMRLIREELQVILTNEEAAEMFGEDILEDLEVLDEEENNPWAICTASVGREDKEKYEKCVMSVKKQNKER